MRTHYCGELGAALVDRSVTLCGWAHRRRDHGGVIFIDLRDREGLAQVVCHPDRAAAFQAAERVRNEFVLRVTGEVRRRPEGMVNPELRSGEIEVLAHEVEIVNPCAALPFQLDDDNLSETTRLTHRVVDLRREPMQKNLRLRYRVAMAVRGYLDAHGFIDIETPMLTRSTPEGARDYLVPSRMHPGEFYALPQSPQLFKQLLMVAGFDRYYQIVRCFRDEDLRADRQPEFTQIDVETSFLDERAIQELMEGLIRGVFRDVLGVELPEPFPRLSYAEVIARYGSDKPDLRVPLGQDKGLVEKGWRPLWVVDFPMFEWDEEEKRWSAMHHPFTSPKDGHEERLASDPGKALAKGYDMVLNGWEIGGGSVRIHRAEVQSKVFKALGISEEEAKAKFGFLLENLQYGAPPHGGIAFGLDRLVTLMAGAESIRDVIAFPKTQRAQDLLVQAPSPVDEKQLRELGLRLREKPRT